MSVNDDYTDYTPLIGGQVRNKFMRFLGVIDKIEVCVDRYGHVFSEATLSSGDRVDCRSFGRTYIVRMKG